MKKPKPNIFKKLTDRYQIHILNPDNFEELSAFNFNWFQLLMVASFLILLTFLLSWLAFTRTPLKEFFFATSREEVSKAELETLIFRSDSIERVMRINEQYLINITRMLNGEVAIDPQESEVPEQVTAKQNRNLFKISAEDSALRKEIENEKFNLKKTDKTESVDLIMYPPVKGQISGEYDKAENHLAIDIVTKKDEPVKSIMQGSVIFAEFSSSTGNVLIIQHPNNFISVYKHNSVILKAVGDIVRAGETIGIVGNSGEITTGPHLHFELWQNGQALNPKDYLYF